MIRITNEIIPIDAVLASTQDEGAGGHVHFIGTIRQEDAIEGIEYQTYLPLAQKQMESVAKEAKKKWSLKKVSVVHRVGWVPVGDAAVVIAVSGVHRKEAFAACEFMINRIKEIVPIWKEGGVKCCHHH
ncbi:MAG: hypothetical protein A2048_05340 [Deltaproteobacteria bacterium GWA2_45_12]|nr:MAG: hypothetical protein A2048_05340 [Deltaproteobacteria bacterium GWA2_45_12]